MGTGASCTQGSLWPFQNKIVTRMAHHLISLQLWALGPLRQWGAGFLGICTAIDTARLIQAICAVWVSASLPAICQGWRWGYRLQSGVCSRWLGNSWGALVTCSCPVFRIARFLPPWWDKLPSSAQRHSLAPARPRQGSEAAGRAELGLACVVCAVPPGPWPMVPPEVSGLPGPRPRPWLPRYSRQKTGLAGRPTLPRAQSLWASVTQPHSQAVPGPHFSNPISRVCLGGDSWGLAQGRPGVLAGALRSPALPPNAWRW